MKFPLWLNPKTAPSPERVNAVTAALTGDRFCSTCKFAYNNEKGSLVDQYIKCRHPSLIMKRQDEDAEDEIHYLVTGIAPARRPVVWDDKYCLTMRGNEKLCGRDGKLWESK